MIYILFTYDYFQGRRLKIGNTTYDIDGHCNAKKPFLGLRKIKPFHRLSDAGRHNDAVFHTHGRIPFKRYRIATPWRAGKQMRAMMAEMLVFTDKAVRSPRCRDTRFRARTPTSIPQRARGYKASKCSPLGQFCKNVDAPDGHADIVNT